MNNSGGLMFSPPDSNGMMKEYRICKDCFPEVLMFIRGDILEPKKKRRRK